MSTPSQPMSFPAFRLQELAAVSRPVGLMSVCIGCTAMLRTAILGLWTGMSLHELAFEVGNVSVYPSLLCMPAAMVHFKKLHLLQLVCIFSHFIRSFALWAVGMGWAPNAEGIRPLLEVRVELLLEIALGFQDQMSLPVMAVLHAVRQLGWMSIVVWRMGGNPHSTLLRGLVNWAVMMAMSTLMEMRNKRRYCGYCAALATQPLSAARETAASVEPPSPKKPPKGSYVPPSDQDEAPDGTLADASRTASATAATDAAVAPAAAVPVVPIPAGAAAPAAAAAAAPDGVQALQDAATCHGKASRPRQRLAAPQGSSDTASQPSAAAAASASTRTLLHAASTAPGYAAADLWLREPEEACGLAAYSHKDAYHGHAWLMPCETGSLLDGLLTGPVGADDAGRPAVGVTSISAPAGTLAGTGIPGGCDAEPVAMGAQLPSTRGAGRPTSQSSSFNSAEEQALEALGALAAAAQLPGYVPDVEPPTQAAAAPVAGVAGRVGGPQTQVVQQLMKLVAAEKQLPYVSRQQQATVRIKMRGMEPQQLPTDLTTRLQSYIHDRDPHLLVRGVSVRRGCVLLTLDLLLLGEGHVGAPLTDAAEEKLAHDMSSCLSSLVRGSTLLQDCLPEGATLSVQTSSRLVLNGWDRTSGTYQLRASGKPLSALWPLADTLAAVAEPGLSSVTETSPSLSEEPRGSGTSDTISEVLDSGALARPTASMSGPVPKLAAASPLVASPVSIALSSTLCTPAAPGDTLAAATLTTHTPATTIAALAVPPCGMLLVGSVVHEAAGPASTHSGTTVLVELQLLLPVQCVLKGWDSEDERPLTPTAAAAEQLGGSCMAHAGALFGRGMADAMEAADGGDHMPIVAVGDLTEQSTAAPAVSAHASAPAVLGAAAGMPHGVGCQALLLARTCGGTNLRVVVVRQEVVPPDGNSWLRGMHIMQQLRVQLELEVPAACLPPLTSIPALPVGISLELWSRMPQLDTSPGSAAMPLEVLHATAPLLVFPTSLAPAARELQQHVASLGGVPPTHAFGQAPAFLVTASNRDAAPAPAGAASAAGSLITDLGLVCSHLRQGSSHYAAVTDSVGSRSEYQQVAAWAEAQRASMLQTTAQDLLAYTVKKALGHVAEMLAEGLQHHEVVRQDQHAVGANSNESAREVGEGDAAAASRSNASHWLTEACLGTAGSGPAAAGSCVTAGVEDETGSHGQSDAARSPRDEEARAMGPQADEGISLLHAAMLSDSPGVLQMVLRWGEMYGGVAWAWPWALANTAGCTPLHVLALQPHCSALLHVLTSTLSAREQAAAHRVWMEERGGLGMTPVQLYAMADVMDGSAHVGAHTAQGRAPRSADIDSAWAGARGVSQSRPASTVLPAILQEAGSEDELGGGAFQGSATASAGAVPALSVAVARVATQRAQPQSSVLAALRQLLSPDPPEYRAWITQQLRPIVMAWCCCMTLMLMACLVRSAHTGDLHQDVWLLLLCMGGYLPMALAVQRTGDWQAWSLPICILRAASWLVAGLGLTHTPQSWASILNMHVEVVHEVLLTSVMEEMRLPDLLLGRLALWAAYAAAYHSLGHSHPLLRSLLLNGCAIGVSLATRSWQLRTFLQTPRSPMHAPLPSVAGSSKATSFESHGVPPEVVAGTSSLYETRPVGNGTEELVASTRPATSAAAASRPSAAGLTRRAVAAQVPEADSATTQFMW